MKFTVATTLAALAGSAIATKGEPSFAVLRFNNKQLTKGRIDPIVFPGKTASHVHTVQGGSNFGISSTGEKLMDSKCTNAKIKGDFSNYWFPAVYFQDPKTGKFESVELYYFNAYYFFEDTDDEVKAFPVGLQLVSGNAKKFSVASDVGSLSTSENPARFTCPRKDGATDPPTYPANSDGTSFGVGDSNNKNEGTGFPQVTCDGTYSPLRADVHFPSCYNPEAGLTAYDSNSAFPTNSNGKLNCPEGWIHVPKLFFEAYWDTLPFQDRWEAGKGEQPFVFANGDVTGYSSHADFMAGWDEDVLQHIIDTCDAGTQGMDKCPGVTVNEEECSIESEIDEEIEGTQDKPLDKLPGDNPLKGFSHGSGGSDGGSDGGNDSGSGSSADTPSATPSAPSHEGESTGVEAPVATNTEEADDSYDDSYGGNYGGDKGGNTLPVEDSVVAVTAPAQPEASEHTGTHNKPPKASTTFTSCKARTTHTVVHTVTVTAEPEAAQQYKRRHMHGHLRRSRHYRP